MISAADENATLLARLRHSIEDQLEQATMEFFDNSGAENALAQSLLARLQALNDVSAELRLSEDSVITLATEREHFRTTRAHNERSRRAMRKRRNGIGIVEQFSLEE